jgi:hypothetical protein
MRVVMWAGYAGPEWVWPKAVLGVCKVGRTSSPKMALGTVNCDNRLASDLGYPKQVVTLVPSADIR